MQQRDPLLENIEKIVLQEKKTLQINAPNVKTQQDIYNQVRRSPNVQVTTFIDEHQPIIVVSPSVSKLASPPENPDVIWTYKDYLYPASRYFTRKTPYKIQQEFGQLPIDKLKRINKWLYAIFSTVALLASFSFAITWPKIVHPSWFQVGVIAVLEITQIVSIFYASYKINRMQINRYDHYQQLSRFTWSVIVIDTIFGILVRMVASVPLTVALILVFGIAFALGRISKKHVG